MKTLCLWVVGTVLVLVSSVAPAATSVSIDGQWWASHGGAARLLLVAGEIDGAETQCYQMAEMSAVLYAAHTQPDSPEKALLRASSEAYKKVSLPCSYSQTFGVYVNLVSKFYREYPDANTVTVGRILACDGDYSLKHNTDKSCVSLLLHH